MVPAAFLFWNMAPPPSPGPELLPMALFRRNSLLVRVEVPQSAKIASASLAVLSSKRELLIDKLPTGLLVIENRMALPLPSPRAMLSRKMLPVMVTLAVETELALASKNVAPPVKVAVLLVNTQLVSMGFTVLVVPFGPVYSPPVPMPKFLVKVTSVSWKLMALLSA